MTRNERANSERSNGLPVKRERTCTHADADDDAPPHFCRPPGVRIPSTATAATRVRLTSQAQKDEIMAARTRRLDVTAKPSLAWVLGLPPHRPPWRRTNKKAKAGPTEEELALVKKLQRISRYITLINTI